MRNILVVTMLSALISGCAADQPVMLAPDGKPKWTYSSISAKEISNRIVAKCLAAKMRIESADEQLISCSIPPNFYNKLAIAQEVSTPYKEAKSVVTDFKLHESGSGILGTASQRVVLIGPSGEVFEVEMRDGKLQEGLQRVLQDVGR
ncbi:hypothetical protein DK842_17860 [Chromobacterium phragmitis]|uniref:hypothetical protein n=1 Tax=Chromobacterium phragmitis TaxID=2202141 RepID=UPI000DECBE7C|nr:hypothetical protein [Chromobacterium phragmitis]AXE31601.1 hypothetical protein DK842_17860 [Chromobacterium phragmitis]